MASRFKGRSYNTLRAEIISFLKNKLPDNWDSTNLADPVVIFAESLAKMGDQLHYTIDELRRECDIATAQRKSSIYSYALREGYTMMLPKGSSGRLSINLVKELDGEDVSNNILHLSIKRFEPIKTKNVGLFLYAANDVDADLHIAPDRDYIHHLRTDMESAFLIRDNSDAAKQDYLKKAINYSEYTKRIEKLTQHLDVVLGTKHNYTFTYSDINADSTVALPEPMIDRTLLKLTVKHNDVETEYQYTNDVIGSGFTAQLYSLTPKFINGSIVLCIEFPTNYTNLFSPGDTFNFEYITIADQTILDSSEIDLSDYLTPVAPEAEVDNKYVSIDIGNGIIGYSEYEDPTLVKENYRKFIQDYSSLLTKDDYTNYIKANYTANCKVFDHSDNYKTDVLPKGTALQPRVIYILTDAPYELRKTIWTDLKERSGRSDCIVMIPYGKDPYSIVVKAECYLLGTSVSSVSTAIKKALLEYYSGAIGDKVPSKSTINYLVHKASDKVVTVDNIVVRDTTFGTINEDFNDVANLSNDEVDNLFNAMANNKYKNFTLALNNTNPLQGQLYTKVDDSYEYVPGTTYQKYPVHEYDKFPDVFPNVCTSNGNALFSYEDIIDYQSSYLLDNESWDYADDHLFERSIDKQKYSVQISNVFQANYILNALVNNKELLEFLKLDSATLLQLLADAENDPIILYTGSKKKAEDIYAALNSLAIAFSNIKADSFLAFNNPSTKFAHIKTVTTNKSSYTLHTLKETDLILKADGTILKADGSVLPITDFSEITLQKNGTILVGETSLQKDVISSTSTVQPLSGDDLILQSDGTILKADGTVFRSPNTFDLTLNLNGAILNEQEITLRPSASSEDATSTFIEDLANLPISTLNGFNGELLQLLVPNHTDVLVKLANISLARLDESSLKSIFNMPASLHYNPDRYDTIIKLKAKIGEFNEKEILLQGNFMQVTCGFTNTTLDLKSDYTKHHYMMPWLNNVIVLIKVIGNT